MDTSPTEAERQIRRLLHGRVCRSRLSQIHARVLRHGLHQSNLLIAQFILACASLRRMAYANLVFLQVHHPNILLFNSMIKGYSLVGPRKEPLHLLSLMKRRAIWPDQFTFAPLLKSCSNLCDIHSGRGVHADVLTLGFDLHHPIRIALVELYVTCGKMDDAMKMHDLMTYTRRDAIINNLLIRGFCKAGDFESGLRVFRGMEERTVVSWNSIITGLAEGGRDAEALELFGEMWEAGQIKLDDATLVIVLPICARLGALDFGRRIHCFADQRGFSKRVVAVGNALIDMYSKCGDLESARKAFDDMPQRSIISWNSMITGLAAHGQGQAGIELFEEMSRIGEEPNEVTFIGILGCCTHAGLVDKGRELFRLMVDELKIEPKLEHYGCMADLLGRNACLKEAYELIRSMPLRASAAIWGALLGSCRVYGELEIAECAAKELIHLEPWNSGNYILLSNIYAEADRWDDVKEVRDLMRDKSVHKAAGQSLLKANASVVH